MNPTTDQNNKPTYEELWEALARAQADLLNLQARTRRDTAASYLSGKHETLVALLPVLDGLEGARKHGDLNKTDDPLVQNANKLIQTLETLGMFSFGEPGEPFDPAIHEAVTLTTVDEPLDAPIIDEVFSKGYFSTDRLLRPASVSVKQAPM